MQSLKDELLLVVQAVRINAENLLSLQEVLGGGHTDDEKSGMKHMKHIERELGQVEARGGMLIKRATCVIESVLSVLLVEHDLLC